MEINNVCIETIKCDKNSEYNITKKSCECKFEYYKNNNGECICNTTKHP